MNDLLTHREIMSKYFKSGGRHCYENWSAFLTSNKIYRCESCGYYGQEFIFSQSDTDSICNKCSSFKSKKGVFPGQDSSFTLSRNQREKIRSKYLCKIIMHRGGNVSLFKRLNDDTDIDIGEFSEFISKILEKDETVEYAIYSDLTTQKHRIIELRINNGDKIGNICSDDLEKNMIENSRRNHRRIMFRTSKAIYRKYRARLKKLDIQRVSINGFRNLFIVTFIYEGSSIKLDYDFVEDAIEEIKEEFIELSKIDCEESWNVFTNDLELANNKWWALDVVKLFSASKYCWIN